MNQNIVSTLPRSELEKVAMLRDPMKTVYLALYSLREASASQVATVTGSPRAHMSMRLIQLVDMGLAEVVGATGREKRFRIAKKEMTKQ